MGGHDTLCRFILQGRWLRERNSDEVAQPRDYDPCALIVARAEQEVTDPE